MIQKFLKKYKVPSILSGIGILLLELLWSKDRLVLRLLERTSEVMPKDQVQLSRILLSLLAILLCCLAWNVVLLRTYNSYKAAKNFKEKIILFKSSLKIIKRRPGIKLEQIDKFRELFDEHKYALNSPKQEKTIRDLISLLGDIRSDNEELKDHDLQRAERSIFVLNIKESLDKIEKIEETIDKYIRKIT